VVPSARAAAAQLPAGPGVYRFRDARNRTLYIGKAVNLRRRVTSYWGDLRDRQHLLPMVRQIARVEAVVCQSEHEAAWLERSVLERRTPPWNLTAGGQEVEVIIRLDESARSSGLTVVHTADHAGSGIPAASIRYFGPYLGGARVRLAAAGLERIYPLAYAADRHRGTARDLAGLRGVDGSDRGRLATALAAVLDRDRAAVASLTSQLAARRDAAAGTEVFELAARIQAELAAVEWITCPQRLASLDHQDIDVAGWTAGLLVRFEIRAGRMCGWRQTPISYEQAQPWLAATPPSWVDFAQRNALLAARLAGDTPPCQAEKRRSTKPGLV